MQMKKYFNLFLPMVFAAGLVAAEPGGPTATLAPVDIEVATSGVSRLSPVALTLTFSEAVSGLGSNDVYVSNGAVTAFSGTANPLVWNIDVAPIDLGNFTILLPADSAVGSGKGNQSAELTLTYDWRYPLDQETVSFQTLWNRPADFHLGINAEGYNTQCASHGTNIYLIYYDTARVPHLVKMDDDGSNVQDVVLSDQYTVTNGNYVALDDGHHRMSIGVDEAGYIHIAGDMHNYSQLSTSHMPVEYQNGQCNYWRSNHAGDITAFTWLGGDPLRSPRFEGHTYMAFTYDANGHLYYYARGRNDGHWTESFRTYSISRYNTTTEEWEIVGGVNEFSDDHNSVLYATSGEEYDLTGSRYSAIHGWLSFDRYNRMHVAAPILNDGGPGPGGHWSSHMLYLQSEDFGRSFSRADGTPVQTPAKIGNPGDTNRADIVFAVSQPVTNEWISTSCSAGADRFGNPFVSFGDGSTDDLMLYGFNSTNAQWESQGNPLSLSEDDDMKMHSDRLGVLTFVAHKNKIYRTWNPSDPAAEWKTHAISGMWNMRLDRRHFMLTGNLRGWNGFNGDLIQINITRPVPYPAPYDTDRDTLPDTWELAHGLDAGNATDAVLDPDSDTLSSLQEYWVGTHPNLASSGLYVTSLLPVAPGQFQFKWESTLGSTYRGWFSEDLNSWTQVFDNVVGSPPDNTVSITNTLATDHGFFRVEAVQP